MRLTLPLKAFSFFFSVVVASQAAQQPWDLPFANDAQSIVRAASAIHSPEDAGVAVLLEDYQFTIDKTARMRSTHRRLFKVIRKEDIEEWATVEQTYAPWHQQKPLIRARVIAAGGTVSWLDQKTIADSPSVQFDSTIFSDSRMVRAPLPAIAPGSIVEYEISEEETPALVSAGISRRITVNRFVSLERLHWKIEAAKNIPLHTLSKLIPDSAVTRNSTKDSQQIEGNLGPFEAKKDFELDLPPDVPVEPWFGFSTGQSWQALASEYSQIVDRQIDAADVKSLLAGVDPKATPSAIATRIATNLHHAIRYTGVEFRDAAIIPAPPAEVLRRGYGDCKDKSALMVAALRSAGLHASVALLASGSGPDVEPELPGLDIFDHVIVKIASDPPLWIDATASEVRIGTLPVGDQGRQALLASADSSALSRTPEQSDAWERHAIEVRFSDFGPSTITETITANGPAEGILRASYGGDVARAKTALESYAKRGFAAKALGKFTRSGVDDLATPFSISVECLQSPQAVTGIDVAQLNLTPALALSELPFALHRSFDEEGESNRKPREHDFLFPEPQRLEYHFHLIPPSLFKAGELPASQTLKLGPLDYSLKLSKNSDGSIDADYQLTIPKRRISTAEFEAAREAIIKLLETGAETVTFTPVTAEFLAIGETGKAIRMLRDHVAKNSADATAHIRFAHVLLTAGLGDAARLEAKKATELDPKSALAWQTLGHVWQHDSFGRLASGNWSQSEAETDWRKAAELDPENILFRTGVADLLRFNSDGELFGPGARLKEAIAAYREILKKSPFPAAAAALTYVLIADNQLDAAREEVHKFSGAEHALAAAEITTLKDGPGRAVVNLQGEVPDTATRAQVLAMTGLEMLRKRRYEDAVTLFSAAERIMPSLSFGSVSNHLKELKRHEEAMLPESDPAYPVQKLILSQVLGGAAANDVPALFAPGVDVKPWLPLSREAAAAVWLTNRNFGPQGLSKEVLADFALSQTKLDSQVTLEKDKDEDRPIRISPAAGALIAFQPIYVIRKDNRYKILGSTGQAGMIGKLILQLAEQKQIEKAQWWLDKIVPDLPSDEVAMGLPAAKGLWSGLKPEMRGPAAIRLAAASVVARSTGSPEAIKILQDAQAKAANPLEKSQLDLALCEAFHHNRNWPELMTASKRLVASRFFTSEGLRYFIKAATESKSWAELERTAQQRLNTSKNDDAALKALILAKHYLGEKAAVLELSKQLTEGRMAGTQERNFAAWLRILNGSVDEAFLNEFNNPTPLGSPPPQDTDSLYTLAMLQTRLEKFDEAQQSLKRAADTQSFVELDARAWSVYGKICHFYGFSEAAEAAWDRARSQPNDNDVARWSLRSLPEDPRKAPPNPRKM